ncbi:MAG: acyl-CoA thioesterase, partial [Devosiaceae bacterium]
MIGPIETIRDTANSWECDENDHINVQSYAWRFDTATRVFLVEAGWQVPHRTARLIRYHAELRSGEPVIGTTGMVSLSDGRVGLEHRLYASQRNIGSDDGVLSATALDILPDVYRDDLSAFDLPRASDDALPKTGDLEPGAFPQVQSLDYLTTTYRGVIPPSAFGAPNESANGAMLTDRYVVGIVSDAATHAWALVGADDAWLRDRGWGRAAVQLHLTYGTRPKAGDVTTIRTALRARSAKTISYRHHIVNVMSQELIAVAEITSLMLNLETRRAMPWPQDMLA